MAAVLTIRTRLDLTKILVGGWGTALWNVIGFILGRGRRRVEGRARRGPVGEP